MPVEFVGDDELEGKHPLSCHGCGRSTGHLEGCPLDSSPASRVPPVAPPVRRWRYAEDEPALVHTHHHPARVHLPDGSWLVCRSVVDARAVRSLLALLVVEQHDRGSG